MRESERASERRRKKSAFDIESDHDTDVWMKWTLSLATNIFSSCDQRKSLSVTEKDISNVLSSWRCVFSSRFPSKCLCSLSPRRSTNERNSWIASLDLLAPMTSEWSRRIFMASQISIEWFVVNRCVDGVVCYYYYFFCRLRTNEWELLDFRLLWRKCMWSTWNIIIVFGILSEDTLK